MKNEAQQDQTEPASAQSIIGAEIKITGNIEASVDLMIEGSVEGDISCKTLIVGENGSIKGNIIADRARIGGKVDGVIDARDLAIEASGAFTGEATYARLKVATGGIVEGTLKCKREIEQKLKLVEAKEP